MTAIEWSEFSHILDDDADNNGDDDSHGDNKSAGDNILMLMITLPVC